MPATVKKGICDGREGANGSRRGAASLESVFLVIIDCRTTYGSVMKRNGPSMLSFPRESFQAFEVPIVTDGNGWPNCYLSGPPSTPGRPLIRLGS